MGTLADFMSQVGTNASPELAGYANAPAAHPFDPSSQKIGDQPRYSRNPSKWAISDDGGIYYGAPTTSDRIAPEAYRCQMAQGIGPILVKAPIVTDNLLELPDDAAAAVLAEFERFWSSEDKFRSYKLLMKRGFMLWGPPGSGKTSCVQLMMKRLIEQREGIVLLLDDPYSAGECLQMVRRIEPKRPVIGIMEDLDALVQRHGEHHYLALLDGEAQVDNIVFLATTNYPERLDRRFVNRPSRFDTIRYVGMPSAEARRVYLTAKDGALVGEDLDKWVADTDGFSLAHLKEIIVAVRCLGQTFEQASGRLNEMRETRPSSDDEPTRARAGFVRRVA